MNRETRQWSVAADMPGGMMCPSGVICGNRLYIGGGRDSKSVTKDMFTECSVTVIATSQCHQQHNRGPLTHCLF